MIKGFFGKPTDITILGSEEGLKGWGVKNTTSFFGQSADTWVRYDENYRMWTAMNLQILMPNVEEVEIGQRLSRYEGKDDIHKRDNEFMNLIEEITKRQRPPEILRIINLLIKFGNIRFDRWDAETNHFRKPSLLKDAVRYLKMIVELVDKLKVPVDISQVRESIKKLDEAEKK